MYAGQGGATNVHVGTPVMAVSPVPVAGMPRMMFGPNSVTVRCMYCQQLTQTVVVPRIGEFAWWMACLFYCLTIVCFWIPFAFMAFKDADHLCGNCRALLGRFRRCKESDHY